MTFPYYSNSSRKEHTNWQDLHLSNTRYTWPGTHAQFSWFMFLLCSYWATETAPLNHSSITTKKFRWYLPSLSHKPVNTCFLQFALLALFNQPHFLCHVLESWSCHLQWCSPYTGPHSCSMEFLIQSGHNTCNEQQAAPYHLSCSSINIRPRKTCVAAPVTNKPSSWNLSNMLNCILMCNHIT